jgi:hypothetical protein
MGIYIGSGSDYYNIPGNNCHGASTTISDNGGSHKSVQSGGTC